MKSLVQTVLISMAILLTMGGCSEREQPANRISDETLPQETKMIDSIMGAEQDSFQAKTEEEKKTIESKADSTRAFLKHKKEEMTILSEDNHKAEKLEQLHNEPE